MADGIQIGRGFVAIDLDEAGAKQSLDVLVEKIKETLREASKKTPLDISTTKADAELDKTDAKVKKVQKDANDSGGAFSGWAASLGSAVRILGLWTPAISAVTLAAQAGAGGVLSLVGAVGNLLGVVGLVPAVGLAAVGTIAALVVGFKGIGTALTQANSPAQLKAQNAALAGLAPNAKDFVKAIDSIKPALHDLRLADQNALFAGLGKTIKSVATVEIPVLKAGLAGVAGAVGSGLGGLLARVGSLQSLADQSLIFTNIKDTLQRLLPAFTSFYNILTSVAAVGGGFLPTMAGHFTTLLDKFDRFVQHARADGSLKQWVQNGITAIDALGRVVGNIGSILGALFQAGQTAGANFLGTLSLITGQFAAFLHTAQGQKDLSTILGSASDAAKVLVPLLKDALNTLAGFAPILSPIANTLAPGVDKVIQALGPALQNLDPGLKALAQGITAILGAVSQLLGPVSRLASDLGVGLGTSLQIVAHIVVALEPLLNGLASAVDFITHSTGALIPILAVTVSGFIAFSKAQDLFSKGSAGKGIADAAKSMSEFGSKAGTAIEKITGSAKAGAAVAGLGDKIGGALKSVGGAIPVIGVALLGVSAIIEAVSQRSKELAAQAEAMGKGLVIGGSAGAAAAQQMQQLQEQVDKARASLAALNGQPSQPNYGKAGGALPAAGSNDRASIQQAQQQLNAATAAAAAYRASLTDTQLAQARVAQAQLDYNNAVRQFGANSEQARGALQSLKSETQVETDAEWAATKATESHQQSLQDLLNQTLASANASANLKLAQLDLADAQKAATAAVKASGAGSEEAQRAEAQYELQLNQTVQAMHDKAMADNAALAPSDQLARTNATVTQGILDLAIAAGKNAPPALQALVEKTYGANAAAIAAGSSVAGLHQQVVTLPDGKQISIWVDSNGQAYVQGLQNQVNDLTSRTYFLRIQPQGPTGPYVITPAPRAAGGPVKAGMPYKVGEHGEEIVVPSRDGYVMPSSETRVALAGVGAHGSTGPTLNQVNNFAPGLSEQQVADMSANSAAWKLRTAR